MGKSYFRHWSKEDILFLKNNFSLLPTEDIANILGRPLICILNYVSRKKLKLTRYKVVKINVKDEYIETIALETIEFLKKHDDLNIYSLQRIFYSKYIYHTVYSLQKALKILIDKDLVEYFEDLNNKKKKKI